MSGAQAPFRGRVQAQGDDIDKMQKGGYSQSWAQDTPITDEKGLEFLVKIEGECNSAQKKEREQSFAKAKNFVKRAGEKKGSDPEEFPQKFQDPKRTVLNARVEIESVAKGKGKTFIRLEESK